MVNGGQSRKYSVGTDWNGSHPSCGHFGWSLPSRLTGQYCVHLLLIHFAFSIIFEGIMPQNLQERIVVHIVKCHSMAILSEKWQECWVCRNDPSTKFCDTTETLAGHSSRGVGVRGIWPLPEKTESWFKWSRTSFHLGSLSAYGDDPPISEDVVRLEHCKQACTCWLLVQAPRQVFRLTLDDRPRGWWGRNAQKVEPQALVALCLPWWVSLHAVSQWWSCSCAPRARGYARESLWFLAPDWLHNCSQAWGSIPGGSAMVSLPLAI